MKYLPDFEFTPFEVALQESVDWFIQVRSPYAFLRLIKAAV
jgi:hypothetical protein